MGKTANRVFSVHPWKVIENAPSSSSNKVAESVFSLGNEYMGTRGTFDEGSSFDTLAGSYFNGVYEYATDHNAPGYKGIVTRTHYMVNSVNYFATKITVDGELLDVAKCSTSNYVRELNLQNGKLTRSFCWTLKNGKKVHLTFQRFLDMENCHCAYQRIEISSDSPASLEMDVTLDFNAKHWGKPTAWKQIHSSVGKNDAVISCSTATTNQSVTSAMKIDCANAEMKDVVDEKLVGKRLIANLGQAPMVFVRYVANVVNKACSEPLVEQAESFVTTAQTEGYSAASVRNDAYWRNFWDRSDIVIENDEENQQGIRFCIFQLQQTYHGADASDNIGAKGLTGEAYSGHAFWDTETYCLPYYIFNNPQAAKYLLEYRYNTLSQAKERALQLDCKGACYPIATLNGHEACNLWQHASLQMQPSTAVAYGVFHYANVCRDNEFLYGHGAEMLVEICRYLVSRGQWNADGSGFGYYCVMGPDEFQMMVNNNTYTNYMGQKTLQYTLKVLQEMPREQKLLLYQKASLTDDECNYWKLCADKTIILYDEKTRLFEQHDGFFKLPHVEVDSIDDKDFPLYSHWSYDRIYRNDMIKQPDVLMFMLLYPGDFSDQCVAANYDYYEPRCIHESSLSPSVHSVIANRIGRFDDALDFFAFATRMDIDDYNRNSCEGLHTTSIAAAWLNVVYGFGGLRSDGNTVAVSPTLPQIWSSYRFNVTVNAQTLEICVDKTGVTITNKGDSAVTLVVYGKAYEISTTHRIER